MQVIVAVKKAVRSGIIYRGGGGVGAADLLGFLGGVGCSFMVNAFCECWSPKLIAANGNFNFGGGFGCRWGRNLMDVVISVADLKME